MHTLFNGLIKEKFVVLNFAEAFRLHTNRMYIPLPAGLDKLIITSFKYKIGKIINEAYEAWAKNGGYDSYLQKAGITIEK